MSKHKINVSLVGDNRVGKSALSFVYTHNVKIAYDYQHTQKYNYFQKLNYTQNHRTIDLRISDSGEELEKGTGMPFFTEANVFAVCFDVKNRDSFNHVRDWVKSIKQHGPVDASILLIATQCDPGNEKHWAVKPEEITELKNELGVKCIETSAMYRMNVKEAFDEVIKLGLQPTLKKEDEEKQEHIKQKALQRVKNYKEMRSKRGKGFTFLGGYNKSEKLLAAEKLIQIINGQIREEDIESPRVKGALHQGSLGKIYRLTLKELGNPASVELKPIKPSK